MGDIANRGVAILGSVAMALNLVWFDLPGHGSAFIQHAAAMGSQIADGHTLFLAGMLLMVALAALIPQWFERHIGGCLLASALIGTAALSLYCLASAALPWAVSVTIIGFTNLLQLVSLFFILRFVIERERLTWAVVCALTLKTLAVYGANRWMGPEAQRLLLQASPLLSTACAMGALKSVDQRAREANAVRIKFEEPLSTVMLAMVLVVGALYATTRVVSNMGFWGTPYAVAEIDLLSTLTATALFVFACYLTLVKADAQLLFRFLPGLMLLFGAYGFLYLGLATPLGIHPTALGIFAQYAELYGEAFVFSVMFFAIRTLKLRPFRVVGITFCVFSVVELLFQQYVRSYDAASLVIVLLTFFVIFGLLIWALWHFYGQGRFDRGARCSECIRAAEMARQQGTPPPECQALAETTMTMAVENVEDPRRTLAESRGLTQRETDVFVLLAQGRSRKFICEELFIADGTASSHIRHVYEKMGVHSKQELLSLVLEYETAPQKA